MGASVIHGAMSTLLAIVVLAPSKSYIFESFFKMWFGIIVFGVCNGFILLPVLLSTFGPLDEVHSHEPLYSESVDTEIKPNQVMSDHKDSGSDTVK